MKNFKLYSSIIASIGVFGLMPNICTYAYKCQSNDLRRLLENDTQIKMQERGEIIDFCDHLDRVEDSPKMLVPYFSVISGDMIKILNYRETIKPAKSHPLR